MSPQPSARELCVTGAWAAAIALIFCGIFYGPAVMTGAEVFFTHDIGASDIWHLHYPLKAFYAQELGEGRLPLWASTLGGGFPIFAEGQVAALYPPNLLLFGLLPLPVAFNWGPLLHALLASAFGGMLARQLGAGRGPACLAGLIFAFSGFMVTHLKHINMVAAAVWAPLFFLGISRFVRRPGARSMLTITASVGMMLLAGHPQLAYNTLLMGGAWALAALARQWGDGLGPLVRRGAGLMASVLLGVGLACVQWLPTLELSRLSPRQGGLSLDAATAFALKWPHLITFLSPYAFGDPGLLTPEPLFNEAGQQVVHPATGEPLLRWLGFVDPTGAGAIFWEVCAYVGLIPLALAVLAVVMGRRLPAVQGAAALTVGSLLLALGKAGGLFWVGWYALPGFDLFRFHGRFLLYVTLGLSLLAALGLTAALERAGKNSGGGSSPLAALVLGAVCALTALDLFFYLGDHNPTLPPDRWATPPPTAQHMLNKDGPGARFMAHNPGFDVFTDAWFDAKGWKGDLRPYDSARQALDPNLGLLYGLTSLTIYQQLYPMWLGHAADLLTLRGRPAGAPPAIDHRAASLFGVRWVVDAALAEAPGFHVAETFAGPPRHPRGVRFEPPIPPVPDHEIRLLENAAAWPVARVVGRARFVHEQGDVPGRLPSATAIRDGAFDLEREVVVSVHPGEAPPPGAAALGEALPPAKEPVGSARLSRPDAQTLVVDVDSPEGGWLVVSETFYPGWEATVDGAPAPIYRANVWGRAVALPPGAEQVVFAFKPRSVGWGGAASAASALLWFLTAGLWRRRQAGGPLPQTP